MRPRLLRRVMNLWPPYLAAAICVRHIADDWSEAVVELGERLANRNFVGTHFGGSLFAMTDPFYALMLMHRLDERYVVWDEAATIEFVAPGRKTVAARFVVSDETVENIRAEAQSGAKCLPQFDVEVRNRAGELIARVRKTVYVRLKPRFRPHP